MKAFEQRITAASGDIDELGHVNNAAFVRWIQEVATAHWRAVAPQAHRDAYVWVVTRHEIDYLRAAAGHPERAGIVDHLDGTQPIDAVTDAIRASVRRVGSA